MMAPATHQPFAREAMLIMAALTRCCAVMARQCRGNLGRSQFGPFAFAQQPQRQSVIFCSIF
jgi:hypothetical protein